LLTYPTRGSCKSGYLCTHASLSYCNNNCSPCTKISAV
jgi:hypothetical protein